MKMIAFQAGIQCKNVRIKNCKLTLSGKADTKNDY